MQPNHKQTKKPIKYGPLPASIGMFIAARQAKQHRFPCKMFADDYVRWFHHANQQAHLN